MTADVRLGRLERAARALQLVPRRDGRAIELEADDGSRLYRIALAGRTTVRLFAFVPEVCEDGEQGSYILETEITTSDERAEMALARIARSLR
jgi:hypothetical protein